MTFITEWLGEGGLTPSSVDTLLASKQNNIGLGKMLGVPPSSLIGKLMGVVLSVSLSDLQCVCVCVY